MVVITFEALGFVLKDLGHNVGKLGQLVEKDDKEGGMFFGTHKPESNLANKPQRALRTSNEPSQIKVLTIPNIPEGVARRIFANPRTSRAYNSLVFIQ